MKTVTKTKTTRKPKLLIEKYKWGIEAALTTKRTIKYEDATLTLRHIGDKGECFALGAAETISGSTHPFGGEWIKRREKAEVCLDKADMIAWLEKALEMVKAS